MARAQGARRRAVVALAAVAVVIGSLGGSAAATTTADPADTPDGLDIRSVSDSLTDEALVLEVTAWQAFADTGAAFRWGFYTGPGFYDGFSVQVHWDPEAGSLVGAVHDWMGDPIGAATFERPAPDTIRVSVDRGVLADSTVYLYEVFTWFDTDVVGGIDDEPVDSVVADSVPVFRLGGTDRYATALADSQGSFAGQEAAAVVLAGGEAAVDALLGAPLSAFGWGPLLLTPPDALDPRVAREIQRVLPLGATVYVLGGPAAVAPAVDAQLEALGFTVVRLAGADRYETAVRVAEAMEAPDTVVFAAGDAPADVAIAAAAATYPWEGGAVLLTTGAGQHPAVAAYLEEHQPAQRHAVGGVAARDVPDATAIVGADRYETAAAVAAALAPGKARPVLVNGTRFADAVPASVLAGRRGDPLLLTPGDSLAPAAGRFLDEHGDEVAAAVVVGGSRSVSDGVREAVFAAVRP